VNRSRAHSAVLFVAARADAALINKFGSFAVFAASRTPLRAMPLQVLA
jgi:hypothetical protein